MLFVESTRGSETSLKEEDIRSEDKLLSAAPGPGRRMHYC